MDLKSISIDCYGYDLEKVCEACSWQNKKGGQEQRELSNLSLGYVQSVLCEKCLEKIRDVVENTLDKK